MAKDAYWFKHDSTSGRGLKMKKMQAIWDHWGKGVYWDVIEVLREQDGYVFPSDKISIQMLGEIVGVKDPVKFQNWFTDCVRIELFKVKKDTFFSQVLCDNMKTWQTKKINGSLGGRPKKTGIITELKTGIKPNQKPIKTIREEKRREEEKREEFPWRDVLFYLNQKTGKKFREVDSNEKIILGRASEGYTLEDFKKVIDNKSGKWLPDPKMNEFLRPETLFAKTHFESYLNEAPPEFSQLAGTKVVASNSILDRIGKPREDKF